MSTDLQPSDAAKIRDEDNWPYWPHLPLLREREKPEYGREHATLLAAHDPPGYVVIHESVFKLMAGEGQRDNRTTYATIEDLLADGWRVD